MCCSVWPVATVLGSTNVDHFLLCWSSTGQCWSRQIPFYFQWLKTHLSLIVGLRNLRSRGVKWFTQSHKEEPEMNPDLLTSVQVIILATHLHCSQNSHTLIERKVASNQNASNLGGWWSWHPSQIHSLILLDHECFKGKKRSHLSESSRWGVRVVSIPRWV